MDGIAYSIPTRRVRQKCNKCEIQSAYFFKRRR
nr:MAG TPA: hypothetical protein [Caudoviricetes sp.]